MKHLILFLALAMAQIPGNSQQNRSTIVPKRNSVYLEAFGQGIYNSLSFDRLYSLHKKVKTSVTVGLTLIPLKNTPDHLFVIGAPVSYNWLFGKNSHHLELGVGLSYLIISELIQYSSEYLSDQYLYFTPKFSYRYQDSNGGLFFRLSFTPPIALMEKTSFGGEYYVPDATTPFGYRVFPWPGVSLGWTMKQ